MGAGAARRARFHIGFSERHYSQRENQEEQDERDRLENSFGRMYEFQHL